MAKKNSEIVKNITDRYTSFHVSDINTNRFTHTNFIQVLKQFEAEDQLSIETIGYSEEVRCIKSITYGHGHTKVLLWSQMHGNESTATRAILDIIKFLTSNDEFNSVREKIAEELTVIFIPMLNPDGTERFQRRTATEIDMNRDAVQLQSTEGKLLNDFVDEFEPDYAFNLHDQRRFYNVKDTETSSSMSFLAPAFNLERETNTSRKKAMQIIVGMNNVLQSYIPGGVGLYDDAYSYRSFGDHIQSKGVSTILVESGWLDLDMEKEAIRKLNFTVLVGAFIMIANNSFNTFSVKDYSTIPDIDTKLFDVLIKNVKITGESDSVVDIGIGRAEYLLSHPTYYSKGQIDDLGDLSSFYGFNTIDGEGLTIVAGKTKNFQNVEDISLVFAKRLLRQGVLFLVTEDIPYEDHVPFPINIIHPRKIGQIQNIRFEGNANFLLVDKNKVLKYIILNGFVMKANELITSANGIVIT